ncbi:MAG: AAA family ATPase [Candidatus Nanohaloarchaea archaeon]|nr:AAA family ATPase [Candidatus Nanohaloarchaea archaeon]
MSADSDDGYRVGEIAEVTVETDEGERTYDNGVEFLLDLDRYDEILDICYETEEDPDIEDVGEFTIEVYDTEWEVDKEDVEMLAEEYQDALDEKADLNQRIDELEQQLRKKQRMYKTVKENAEQLEDEIEDLKKGLSRLGTVDEIDMEEGEVIYTPEGANHSKVREMREGFLERLDEGDEVLLDNKTLAIQDIYRKFDEIGSEYETDEENLPDEFPEMYGEEGVLDATGGILLYGPPGTGKTMSVQALANEHDMSFYSINGPEIMSKWVGKSEEKIREVAHAARESSPAIVMFDELDSIAQQRGGGSSNNVGERVVSQLLTMMEGMEEYDDVYWVATTNRKDLIDEALLRPGRFGTQIEFPRPDEEATEEIAQQYMPDDIAEDVTAEITGNEEFMERNSGALIHAVKERAVENYLVDLLEEGEEKPAALEGDVEKDDLSIIADEEHDYFAEAVEEVYGEEVSAGSAGPTKMFQ